MESSFPGVFINTDDTEKGAEHIQHILQQIKLTTVSCIWQGLMSLREHSKGTVAKYKSVKLILQGNKQWSSSTQLSDGQSQPRNQENTLKDNQKLFSKFIYNKKGKSEGLWLKCHKACWFVYVWKNFPDSWGINRHNSKTSVLEN